MAALTAGVDVEFFAALGVAPRFGGDPALGIFAQERFELLRFLVAQVEIGHSGPREVLLWLFEERCDRAVGVFGRCVMERQALQLLLLCRRIETVTGGAAELLEQRLAIGRLLRIRGRIRIFQRREIRGDIGGLLFRVGAG